MPEQKTLKIDRVRVTFREDCDLLELVMNDGSVVHWGHVIYTGEGIRIAQLAHPWLPTEVRTEDGKYTRLLTADERWQVLRDQDENIEVEEHMLFWETVPPFKLDEQRRAVFNAVKP